MRDRAGLQHVGPIGNRERKCCHLVDQQDRGSLLAQLRQQVIKIFQKLWRKPERRLIEHQHLGTRHQAARNRQHLLFAAGKKTGALIAAAP